MGLSKLWGKDSSGNRGFVFSHIKTIYYNWAQKKLLSTKLDEMDSATNGKIDKTSIVQVESTSQTNVPSSAYLKTVKDALDGDISELNANGPTYFYFRHNSTNGYLDLSYIYVKDLVILAGIFVINIETPQYSIAGNVPKSIIPNGFLVYDTLGEYRFQINPIGIFQNSDALPAGTYIVTTAYIKS